MIKENPPDDQMATAQKLPRVADATDYTNPKWWLFAIFIAALLLSGILTAWLVTSGQSPYAAASHGSLSTGSRKARGLLVLLQLGEAATVHWGYAVSAFAIPLAILCVVGVISILFRSGGRAVPDWLKLGSPGVMGWWLGSVFVTMIVGFHASPVALAGTWTEIADSTTASHNEDSFLPKDSLGRMTFFEDGRQEISVRSASQGVGMDVRGRFSAEGRRLSFTAEGGTGIDGAPMKLDDLRLLNQEMATPDEVLRITTSELVLKDLSDQSVTHWHRVGN